MRQRVMEKLSSIEEVNGRYDRTMISLSPPQLSHIHLVPQSPIPTYVARHH